MADGIRIQDAALEISPASLEALVKRQGASVTVTSLDLSISPEALNTLLTAFAPKDGPVPSAAVSDGRLRIAGQNAGRGMSLDLQAGGFRIEITAEGLRIKSG